jgi:hypothetical protein
MKIAKTSLAGTKPTYDKKKTKTKKGKIRFCRLEATAYAGAYDQPNFFTQFFCKRCMYILY